MERENQVSRWDCRFQTLDHSCNKCRNLIGWRWVYIFTWVLKFPQIPKCHIHHISCEWYIHMYMYPQNSSMMMVTTTTLCPCSCASALAIIYLSIVWTLLLLFPFTNHLVLFNPIHYFCVLFTFRASPERDTQAWKIQKIPPWQTKRFAQCTRSAPTALSTAILMGTVVGNTQIWVCGHYALWRHARSHESI